MNWSILAWIAGLIFVYLFGIFEGRGQGYKKRKKEEQEEMLNAPKPIAERVMVDDPGSLRLKNDYGSWRLDLDGARVDVFALTADQRKRLIELITVMRPWLESKPAPAPPIEPPAPPPPQPTVAPVQPAPSAPPPIAPAPAPATSSAKKDEKPAGAPTTMIGQIDAILQARIANTPLASRGVSLMQTPSGEVNVFIGLERFDGIDAVKDEEVKAVIRAAIAEWEEKYTPGLR